MRNKLYFATIVIILLMMGCNSSKPAAPNDTRGSEEFPVDTPAIIPTNEIASVLSITAKEVEFKNLFALRENQTFAIYNSVDDRLFYEIVEQRFIDEDAEITPRSMAYWFTVQIGIFDTRTGTVVMSKDFTDYVKCVSGATNGETMLYCIYEFSPTAYEARSTCDIYHMTETGETLVFSCFCDVGYMLTPEIKLFNDGSYIYSYSNIVDGTTDWGFNTFNGISNQSVIEFENTESDRLLRTLFSSDGRLFAFYCVMNQVGTVIIGDNTGEIARMPLRTGEKMYDYCIMNDKLLLCLSIDENTSEWRKEIVLRSFDNEDIAEIKLDTTESYHRMESYDSNAVVTTSNGFNNYVVVYDNETIYKYPIVTNDVPDINNGSVGFNRSSPGVFFADYSRDMRLLKISAALIP